uniref:Uncharacterized protein n=1 Tax=Xiphophorus couchianus TaxID=32473 RepID=A0A3B5LCQ0_9TELE
LHRSPFPPKIPPTPSVDVFLSINQCQRNQPSYHIFYLCMLRIKCTKTSTIFERATLTEMYFKNLLTFLMLQFLALVYIGCIHTTFYSKMMCLKTETCEHLVLIQ